MALIHEFHARYSLIPRHGTVQMDGVNFLSGRADNPPEAWNDLSDLRDQSARLELLAQSVLTPYKDYARVGRRGNPAGLLHAVNSGLLNKYFEYQTKTFLEPLRLYPSVPDLVIFPNGVWMIYFKFKLFSPYISKDDTDFYVIDNPVRKERVFKVPYIAASQWKGALRAAMVKQLVEASGSLSDEEFANRRLCQSLLFGDEKGEEQDVKSLAEYLDNAKPKSDAANLYRQKLHRYFAVDDDIPLHHAGCLHFYPTYFTQIGLDVINPHDRETGVGIQPIYFECVPSNAEGTFALLYVPFDHICKNRQELEKQAAFDMCLVAEGVRAMMTCYGFGAKTSSGYGLAKPELSDGMIVLKAEGAKKDQKDEAKPQQPEESFVKYLNSDGSVKNEFKGGGEVGLMSNPEYSAKGQQLGGGSQTEFKKFRLWYKEHGEQWQKFIQAQKVPVPRWPTWTFNNFDELVEQSRQIAHLLIINERSCNGS